MRALANQVYDIQFNSNFNPVEVSELEQLNGRIVQLSTKIANLVAQYGELCRAYSRTAWLYVSPIVKPHIIRLSANSARIKREFEPLSYSEFIPKFGRAFDLHDTFANMKLGVTGGLSDAIIEPQFLVTAGDAFTINYLSDFKTFYEVVDYCIGLKSDGSEGGIMPCKVITKPCDLWATIRHCVNCENDSVLCYDFDELDRSNMSIFSAISKASAEVLDMVYDANGNIPDKAVELLGRMAFSLVNVFNLYFMVTYDGTCKIASDVNKAKVAAENVQAALNICLKA